MGAPVDDLAGAIEDLRQTTRALEARVARLEAGIAQRYSSDDRRPAALSPEPDWPLSPSIPDAGRLAVLAGQGLLALAGAYLLRALTEQRVLPTSTGFSVGTAYALGWLAVAWSDGRRGRTLRAFTATLVSAVIAYPLLWEATTRIRLLDAAGAALALAAVTGAALAVASTVRLQSAAWIVVSFGLTTAVAMIPATERLAPFVLFATGVGVATLWLGYVRDWFGLRWPVAVVADLLVCVLVFSVPPGRGLETPRTAVAVALLLTGAYLASIIARTLWRARRVLPFEIVQGSAALALGIGGALVLPRGGSAAVVGWSTLLAGIGCYIVAFTFVARQLGFRANFHFYASLGLALVLTGITILASAATAALIVAVLCIAAAAVAVRFGPRVLVTHAAVFGVAGALHAGVGGAALARLALPAGEAWPPVTVSIVVVTLACAVAVWVAMRGRPGPAPALDRVACLVLLAIVAAGVSAGTIAAIAAAGEPVDAGRLATLRTVVIACATVVLATLDRSGRLPEAAWLAYAALAVSPVKLLVEDFQVSRPSTLFIALAAYGGALIMAPRLARRRSAAARSPEQADQQLRT